MFIIKHRRRREQKTNAKKRLALLKSDKTRVIIRRLLSGMQIQFIDYDANGDKTLVSVVSKHLKKLGWNYSTKSVPASYLTGLIAGKKALESDINEAVLDTGLQTLTKGSRIYAALKGLVDAGVNIPHSAEIFPSSERLNGDHIQNINKEEFSKNLEEMKKKITG